MEKSNDGGWLGGIEDTLGFGVKDVFELYKGINQANLDKSYQRSQNNINEWNAKASLLSQQMQRNKNQSLSTGGYSAAGSAIDAKKYIGIGLIAVGVLGAIYMVTK